MQPLSSHDLAGLWVPIVTPFDRSGAVDTSSIERLASRLLVDGAAGLVALGTTGEPATLRPEERALVASTLAATCRRSSRPLIVGTGSNSTQGTIDEIEVIAAAADMAAALVVVPYYTRPSQAAVVEHFEIVADRSPVPIVAYNVPYRTACELEASALLDLAAHDNIIGLKQAVGALDLATLNLIRSASDFAVLAGDDAFACPSILMGARGAIAAAAHLCTPLFVQMVAAAGSGDANQAVGLANRLLTVVEAGFAEPNPSVWKGALNELGEIERSSVRRPLTSASASSIERLLAAADAANDAA